MIENNILKQLQNIISTLKDNNYGCLLLIDSIYSSTMAGEYEIATSASSTDVYRLFCDKMIIEFDSESTDTLILATENVKYKIMTSNAMLATSVLKGN